MHLQVFLGILADEKELNTGIYERNLISWMTFERKGYHLVLDTEALEEPLSKIGACLFCLTVETMYFCLKRIGLNL